MERMKVRWGFYKGKNIPESVDLTDLNLYALGTKRTAQSYFDWIGWNKKFSSDPIDFCDRIWKLKRIPIKNE